MTNEKPQDPKAIDAIEAEALWRGQMSETAYLWKELFETFSQVVGPKDLNKYYENIRTEILEKIKAKTKLSDQELRKYAAFHVIIGSGIEKFEDCPIFDLPDESIMETFLSVHDREMRRLGVF